MELTVVDGSGKSQHATVRRAPVNGRTDAGRAEGISVQPEGDDSRLRLWPAQ
jgi:hypothetical protein